MSLPAQANSTSYVVVMEQPDDFPGWRSAARSLLVSHIPPEQVSWRESDVAQGLFAATGELWHDKLFAPQPGTMPAVPRAFLDLAEQAILHSDPQRFAMLYELLWRLQTTPTLLADHADPLVQRLEQLVQHVRRDIHKMRAFVRFRLAPDETGQNPEHYVAWFEPQHHILRANAAFFVKRFANMHWSILTPRGSLHWDGAILQEGPAAQRSAAPQGDDAEILWRSFYSSIFNPARLKISAMLKEMPRRYWQNLPEATLIPNLIATAQAREAAMLAAGANPFAAIDRPASLETVAASITTCRRCAIGCNGTRAVGGEGPHHATLMIVGEQPGDYEEQQGRPFVGPAGQLLEQHLAAAGLQRSAAWVTNAVKHFKFDQLMQGDKPFRQHRTPAAGEIDTCRYWLEAELELVAPRFVLALGASAARALLGRSIALASQRGRPIALSNGRTMWLTSHPSALLRMSAETRPREEQRFAADLTALAAAMAQQHTPTKA